MNGQLGSRGKLLNGERIRELRFYAALEGQQLAALVGVTKQAISLIELNRRRTGSAVAHRIAAALGVPLEEIDGTRQAAPQTENVA